MDYYGRLMTYLQTIRTQIEMLLVPKCYLFSMICFFVFSWILITSKNRAIVFENLIVKTPQSLFDPTKSSRDYLINRDEDVDTVKNETARDSLPGSLKRKL